MAYNLDDLWDRVDTKWSALSAKALVAIAIEIRGLRRELQLFRTTAWGVQADSEKTKIGGSA